MALNFFCSEPTLSSAGTVFDLPRVVVIGGQSSEYPHDHHISLGLKNYDTTTGGKSSLVEAVTGVCSVYPFL